MSRKGLRVQLAVCCESLSDASVKVYAGSDEVASLCYDGWKQAGLPELPRNRKLAIEVRVIGLKKAKKSKKLETVEV